MIVNILRFSFKDGTTEEQKAEALAAMRRTASVDSVAFSTVGQDLGDPSEGYTHTYLAAVPDLAALERYMHDPVHIAGDFVLMPHLEKISPVRLSDDPDPELNGKVMALHLAKAAKYPEWARLVAALSDGRIPADA